MIKVWRNGRGRFFISCPNCGSHGTHHVVTETQVTPETKKLIQDHRILVGGFRKKFEDDANIVVRDVNVGKLTREEGAIKVGGHYRTLINNVTLAEADAKSKTPPNGVKEIATGCPWCQTKEEVPIEELPDDQEPAFNLGGK